MPRITPIVARGAMPPDQQKLFDDVTSVYNGRVVGPFRMLLHSPDLAWRVSEIGRQLRLDTVLTPDAREMAIMVVAREMDCLYEWYAHEPQAMRAGISEAARDAVRNRKPLDGVQDDEAMIIRYVRELLQDNRVKDGTFQAVLDRFGIKGIVELTQTVGFYRMFAFQLNAFEVAADGPVDLPISQQVSNVAP